MSILFGTTILWDALCLSPLPAPLLAPRPAPAALLSARAAAGCDGSILRGLDRLFLLMQMV
ncbi:hypothetical protein [Streptomyces sp. SID13031]|uniref:hypothetical protein n=1 Tax=Streptomyces sp. SID13031 TaxID=2706046 RepID=UPI0019459BA2|nr:hypothetical protein [Streptomyces sp. SID13031]